MRVIHSYLRTVKIPVFSEMYLKCREWFNDIEWQSFTTKNQAFQQFPSQGRQGLTEI